MMYDYECQGYPDNPNNYDNFGAYPYQSVGMTYVPMQKWSRPLRLEDGFYKGTVFQDLDKPFLGRYPL